jgi:ribosomal subunit interface protein
MQITVSGKHLEVGYALQQYVETGLHAVVKKYFEHAISADVVFTKIRYLFRTDIIVNEGTGTNVIIKAGADDEDVYTSFDLASLKIEKQLRRYKGRLRDHHKSKADKAETSAMSAIQYTLSNEIDNKIELTSDSAPLIIAETPTEIERLTVSDAVMRMDLGQLPAVLFINKKNGAINVIYRREDGNITWIDSSSANKKKD